MVEERGVDPAERYLFLADGGGAFAIEDVGKLWDELMGGGEMSEVARRVAEDGGWLFSGYELDADMNHWEMHPEGNEVLFVTSGAMELVFEEAGGDRHVMVEAGQACVVPQGVWHRQVVREVGRYLAMTYGRGTKHRSFEG